MFHYRKLNRWERLWVVVGLVYGVAIAVAAAWNFPQHLTINEQLGDGDVFNGEIVPVKSYWYVRFDMGWSLVEAVAQDPTTREYLFLRNGQWSKPQASLRYRRVSPTSGDGAAELLAKQAAFVGLAFVGWLLTWSLVYLAGVGVEIIKAGRSKKKRAMTKRADPVLGGYALR
jgi:hypothetical protein